MDEPFGALDALTREKMNLELLNIWKKSGKTIVFVTHGIAEAVFLGTRVVVLTAGPARMATTLKSICRSRAHWISRLLRPSVNTVGGFITFWAYR